MQDLFLDYDGYNREYLDKKELYNQCMLYQFELLDGMYHNLVEIKPGNDLFCIDYMDFSKYTSLVSSQYVAIFRQFLKDLENLKKEYECAFNLKEAIKKRINLFSSITFTEFIRLLQIFGIKFDRTKGIINVYFGEEVYPFIVFDTFNLVDENCEVSPIMQYILGEDGINFIKFYINHQSNIRNRCGIDDAYTLFKKTCINR